MKPTRFAFLLTASLTALLSACGSAYADKPSRPALSPPRVGLSPAPYQVDLIGEDGAVLSTYAHRGRFYVLGEQGRRYSIRVTNPTAMRVEAVLSVDGLDVVDGRAADFVHKRGYVIPAYGQVVIDGFRTSMAEVATFRFSSVGDSYAGRKGIPRNVGVIGVALFAEREQPRVYLPTPAPEPYYDEGGVDVDIHVRRGQPAPSAGSTGGGRGGAQGRTRASADSTAPAPASPSAQPSARTSAKAESRAGGALGGETEACCGPRPQERPGLGTEFGEARGSRVEWVEFVRANPTHPTAMAELRYNDRDGLAALGIRFTPPVPPDEIYTRETADPFPGASFAEPPR